MRRLAVLTSGGDAPGMNTALRAVTRTAAAHGIAVLGVEAGYDGLMAGRWRPLTEVRGDALAPVAEVEQAAGLGGTLLGSVRSPGFREPEGRRRARARLAEAEVDGLVVVGGNGSLAGAHALATEGALPVVGVPASIDNDIGCTSTALGVDTALNTILEACDRVSDTARAHRRAFLVEVMGRHCGYLAMAAAAAASADAVLFPEGWSPGADVVGDAERVIRAVFEGHPGPRRALILKAEGVAVPTSELVRALQPRLDAHLPGVDVRAVVLGHVVRGGAPSAADRLVAARLGYAAVQALRLGRSDVMLSWRPHDPPEGAEPTADPAVVRVPLEVVLAETDALLDGSSEVTRRRVRMMQAIQGVLTL